MPRIKDSATDVITRCDDLKRYWQPRDSKMRQYYRMIEMVDELKTEKMESFVGNDPRSLYNLVLHLLDVKIPHRVEKTDITQIEESVANAEVNRFFETAWKDVAGSFRRRGPRQSLNRARLGYMLATGWYAEFSIVSDDGSRCYLDVWSPTEVFPMWDGDWGLDEVAHIFEVNPRRAISISRQNRWEIKEGIARQWARGNAKGIRVYDYWWVEVSDDFPFARTVWNAIVIDGQLVKFEQTRFKKIPIYVAPVGGLPDVGSLSEGAVAETYSSTLKLHTQDAATGDRWKQEIGQSIIATNEHIYRTWNKWWSFSLQLLRDTAQPRIFERSASGKAIVRPEDVFRRGAIFRGGPMDNVEFIGTPPIPLELRSTQLDLEAMMQRGGVNWGMYGSLQGQISAYVMSQIAASANQVMKPFHQAFIDLNTDIDNDWLEDIRERGVKPYGWEYPADLSPDTRATAEYEIEIPGDLVQRATTARMLDPEFQLSYSYVVQKLFPDIKDPLRERARIRADQAELHMSNAVIALIQYHREQAAYLEKIGDVETARLYSLAADAALAQLSAMGQPAREPQQPAAQVPGLGRPEAVPQLGPGV